MKCLVVNNIFLSLLWGVVNCPHLSYSAWMHHSALFVLVFTPQAVSVCDLYLHEVYDVVVRCAGATNVFFQESGAYLGRCWSLVFQIRKGDSVSHK